MSDEEKVEEGAADGAPAESGAPAASAGDVVATSPAPEAGAAPQGAAPQGAAPQGAAPQGAAPQSSAPHSSAPQDTRPSEERDEAAYKVTLPAFQGPLDLLLHLIKKHEVDIYDIPILLITEQYNAYLDAMTELDLDIAADYIYMASLLINIKSRMLLPRDESAEGDPGDDPRKELVDRLLDYQRFKAVAESFAETDVLRMGMWTRPRVPLPGSEEPAEVDMSDVGLFDLIDAFRTALARYKQAHPQSIELQRTVHKVSDKMRELYLKVREKSPIRLQWFLEGRDRNELIAVFLGMLELVRLGGIALQQGSIFGEILVNAAEKEIDEETFALFDNS